MGDPSGHRLGSGGVRTVVVDVAPHVAGADDAGTDDIAAVKGGEGSDEHGLAFGWDADGRHRRHDRVVSSELADEAYELARS
jgi:hypothetical protein